MKSIILVVSVNYLCRYSFSRNVFSDFPLHDLSFQFFFLFRNDPFRLYPSQELFFQIISFSGIVVSDPDLSQRISINEEISLILPYRKESAVYRPNFLDFLDFRIHILYAIRHTPNYHSNLHPAWSEALIHGGRQDHQSEEQKCEDRCWPATQRHQSQEHHCEEHYWLEENPRLAGTPAGEVDTPPLDPSIL